MMKSLMGAVVVSLMGALSPAAVFAADTAFTMDAAVPSISVDVPSRYLRQNLPWAACPTGALPGNERKSLECATMVVPRDWRNPEEGTDLTIAIGRIRLNGTDPRQTIVINPGGPGGPSVSSLARHGISSNEDILKVMDVVAFDPRGTGSSTRVLCDRLRDAPLDPRDHSKENLDRIAAYNKRLVAGCAARSNGLLPFITTEQTVHDIDLLRALMGREQINWLGYSAGTWMGAYYATYFPHRVGRFVFDSSVDFTNTWQDTLARMPMGFERRFRADFAPWAAKHKATLQLGATAEEVREYYETLRARLNTSPIIYRETPINGARLDGIIVEHLYSSRTFATLAGVLRSLSQTADSGSATVAATATDTAASPGRAMAGMSVFPQVNRWPDEMLGTFLAITCNDTRWSQDRSYWEQFSRLQGRDYPLAGWWQVDNPCAYWNPPRLNMPVPTGKNLPPVLMVQSRHDPATPYEGAVIAHNNFANSRMITVENEGDHAIYGKGNRCVDEAVNQFLISRTAPRSDITCQGMELPLP